MRYQKPIVVNLSSRAVSGQTPLACISGDDATSSEICLSGSTGAGDSDCKNGTEPSGGPTCYSGNFPFMECIAGMGADTHTCASGPLPYVP